MTFFSWYLAGWLGDAQVRISVRIIDAEVTGWRGGVLRYPNIVTQSTLDSAGCIFSSGSTLVSQSWLVRISRINCEEMRLSRAVRRALTEGRRRMRTVHWFEPQPLPRLPFLAWLHWLTSLPLSQIFLRNTSRQTRWAFGPNLRCQILQSI